MTYHERLKKYCQSRMIKKNDIARYVGITPYELYNIFNGYQETVKGMTKEEVKTKIHEFLGTVI